MPWSRPDSVPVGQVWSRFQGRSRNGESPMMYQIRDLEDSYKEQCIDMMLETFLRDEPLCRILDISSDPVSIATIRSNWEHLMSQRVSLACFSEEGGRPARLVAVNVVMVIAAGDEEVDLDQVKGESWKQLLQTLMAAEHLVDVFQHYGVDAYMSSSGLTVDKEFRGQNIGARMIEAREPFCKALGIKATSTVYTAVTSQVLAAKSGFEVLAVLPYDKMLEKGVDLRGCECTCAKVMGKKYLF